MLLASLTWPEALAALLVILVLWIVVSRLLGIVPADARQAEEAGRRQGDSAFQRPRGPEER